MLKKIANLKGVKTLSKEEQRNLRGGYCGDGCDPIEECCYRCAEGSDLVRTLFSSAHTAPKSANTRPGKPGTSV